jgi:hypothetical protein
MPRDGSNVYHRPTGTDAIPNNTIESAKYNANVVDVETDLNTPRPIVAGGTGANNARDAMTSLQGDVAYQVVTNYDSYAFVSGSFYSAAGATSAPTGNAFIGQCYTSDPAVVPPAVPAGQNMFIEARDVTNGANYLRQKTAGVWGTWTLLGGSWAALDAAYVNVVGDSMTGRLDITMPNPILSLNKSGSTNASVIYGTSAGAQRWSMSLGDSTPESGSNAGSDFIITRYTDAGVLLGNALAINRANGGASLAGTITVGTSSTTGTCYFGNSGSAYLTYGGGNFILNGGPCVVNNYVMSVVTTTTGTYYFGNSGTKYLTFDNANFIFSGAPLVVGASINAAATATSGTYGFGTGGTKYLTFDGSKFIFAGGNVWHGSPAASVDAPLAAGATVATVFPAGVSGVDRGILFLSTSASNLYAYFTQSTISNSVGSIGGSTTTTSYNTASSGELKEDLKSFDAGNIIDATNVYDFAWKKTGERSYGVIAQQAIDIYPMAVTHMQVKEAEGGEFWGVDYSKYVPVLLQELKALRARVAALEGK